MSRPERMKPSNWGKEGVWLITGSRLKTRSFCARYFYVEVIHKQLLFRRVSEFLSRGGNY